MSAPLFPDGRSIGTIRCELCDVEFELGPTQASSDAVMDRFFAAHTHPSTATEQYTPNRRWSA